MHKNSTLLILLDLLPIYLTSHAASILGPSFKSCPSGVPAVWSKAEPLPHVRLLPCRRENNPTISYTSWHLLCWDQKKVVHCHVTLVTSPITGSHVTRQKLQFAEEGPTWRVESYELLKTFRWCERLIKCYQVIACNFVSSTLRSARFVDAMLLSLWLNIQLLKITNAQYQQFIYMSENYILPDAAFNWTGCVNIYFGCVVHLYISPSCSCFNIIV